MGVALGGQTRVSSPSSEQPARPGHHQCILQRELRAPLNSAGQVHGGWLFFCRNIRLIALSSVWAVLLRLMSAAARPRESSVNFLEAGV